MAMNAADRRTSQAAYMSAYRQRRKAEGRPLEERKPCGRCGGPKPAGERRKYCDACQLLAPAEKADRARQNRKPDPGAADRTRKWRRDNPEKSRELQRRRAQRSPESAARRQRRYRARKAVGSVDYGDVLLIDPCAYCCGRSEVLDHIDAVARGGEDSWTNITGACTPCNQKKSAKPLLQALLSHVNRPTEWSRP